MTATTEPATNSYLLHVLRRTFPAYATWSSEDTIQVDRAAFAHLMTLIRTDPRGATDAMKMIDNLLATPAFLAEADKMAVDQFWEQSGNMGHVGSAVVTLIRGRIRAALFR